MHIIYNIKNAQYNCQYQLRYTRRRGLYLIKVSCSVETINNPLAVLLVL